MVEKKWSLSCIKIPLLPIFQITRNFIRFPHFDRNFLGTSGTSRFPVHLQNFHQKSIGLFSPQSFTRKVKTHFLILKKWQNKNKFRPHFCNPPDKKKAASNLSAKQTSLKDFWVKGGVDQSVLNLSPLTMETALGTGSAVAPRRHPPVQNSVLISTAGYKKYTKDICQLTLETSKDTIWTCIKCKSITIMLLFVPESWKAP